MWKKVKDCETLSIQALAAMALVEKKNNRLITWPTSDGLVHLCSFETLAQIKETEIEPNTKFTLWEKK